MVSVIQMKDQTPHSVEDKFLQWVSFKLPSIVQGLHINKANYTIIGDYTGLLLRNLN